MSKIEISNPIAGSGNVIESQAVGSPALGATTAIHAAVTDTGTQQVITTGITQPDVPRNVTATAGGTSADVAAVQPIVEGTDINDQVITETLPAFTVNTTGTVTGSKAFKTITKITLPAHDGTGATTAIGTGSKLGLNTRLSRDSTVRAFFNGVKEATAPTITFDATNISGNTATLNSALNGSAVIVDFYDS